MLEQEYQLRFFAEEGFSRKICKSCGTPFWSLTDLKVCQDTPCVEYGFINEPLTKKNYGVNEMRERFLSFFEQRGHQRIKRYPVVARWREDVFLVNASIYDFQPLVTSGTIKPPANPLVISQPCVRLSDLDVVGKTGKHLTCFEMLGHHAFNSKNTRIYWKEETTKYCHTFLTQALGIDENKIVYREHPWSGGGNAGPAPEVCANGLELATLVFMNLKEDRAGKVELNGTRYSKMDMEVVDPGYGLERLVWVSQGTRTIYEAVYPDVVNRIIESSDVSLGKEEVLVQYAKLAGMLGEKKYTIKNVAKRLNLSTLELKSLIEPLQKVYGISDHMRSLAFLLGDGVVPSNVKVGYLARLLIRKTLRLLEEINATISISELVGMHAEKFSDLEERIETMSKILELEGKRYRRTVESGKGIVRRMMRRKKKISTQDLLSLYDTHGVHPSVVKKITPEINVPQDFYSRLAKTHEKPAKAVEVEKKLDQPPTKLLYYEDTRAKDFDAVVLWASGKRAVLDRTAFYPEGGGQPSDTGILTSKEKRFNVKKVEKIGDVVVHHLDRSIGKGEVVRGRIDWPTRYTLMKHHTATHIMLSACRAVLGDHVWQMGAKKSESCARLDLSHFKRITDQEIREIELLANYIVMDNRPVEKLWMNREDAEKKHGFRLYQGGVPPGDKLRVVRIAGFDVQACAGTHCDYTSEVGPIKILRVERLQDGIERIEFASSVRAIKEIQKMELLVKELSRTFKVVPEKLPETAKKFFNQWKEYRKKVDKLKRELARMNVGALLKEAEVLKGVKIVTHLSSKHRMKDLITFAKLLIKDSNVLAILGSTLEGANLVIARGKTVPIDCSRIMREVVGIIGGEGGGKPDFAQGGGKKVNKTKQAIHRAKTLVKELL